jgi:hypothetical protein
MMEGLISDEYKALLQAKHAAKPWGGAGKSWVPHIAPLLNRFPAGSSVLDFGCGRGTFKTAMLELRPDLEILEYDPGVAGKDVLPRFPVTYVVCTDVMEHVEGDKVEMTLRLLDFLARDGIFFNIDTALSKSFLPDGRNTHITIHPAEWWLRELRLCLVGFRWTVVEATRSRLVVHGRRVWADE